MRSDRSGYSRRGFALRDLAIGLTCLLVAAGLVVSLGGANRSLSQATVCAANQHTLFGGLVNYINTYNSYPPHNPYPQYAPSLKVGNLDTLGWDPNLGWIMTYGLGLEPPARFDNGHFNWMGLELEELPDVVVCPSLRPGLLNPADPEIDATSAYESFIYRYALSYQTSGTCRAAVRVVTPPGAGRVGTGGRNPAIPDPSMGSLTAHPCENSQGGTIHVWVYQKTPGSRPDDPSFGGGEYSCWIQAVHPAEVQDPARLYYLADSRDYRPVSGTTTNWPPAGINDGWLNGYGNKVYLGSRHFSYANVLYLDGTVSRDNLSHGDARWNMDYDPTTQRPRSSQWRASTFATDIPLASIRTQAHIMPVLMVKGWEYFFDADGVIAK